MICPIFSECTLRVGLDCGFLVTDNFITVLDFPHSLGLMLRPATTHLLIALVLICPYLCLGEAVGGLVAPCQTHVCSCNQQEDSSSDKTPESPNDSDPDCLCHGAIFDASRSADDELASSVAMCWLLEVASAPTNLSLAAVSFESPHQFPPFSTGRDVCMLTCTLQL